MQVKLKLAHMALKLLQSDFTSVLRHGHRLKLVHKLRFN